MPKYQNIIKVSKSVFQLKISKYRLYRRRFLRGFRHFSAFFAIYPNILEKMRQNVKKCKNPSHQISEIFRKSANNGHILILWLYFIFWYFAGFLHFHFEICENLQPASGARRQVPASPGVAEAWIQASRELVSSRPSARSAL